MKNILSACSRIAKISCGFCKIEAEKLMSHAIQTNWRPEQSQALDKHLSYPCQCIDVSVDGLTTQH